MAFRTTETAVREIIETSLESAQLVAFIADASLWVTEELLNRGLTDARLEIIERYLACAMIRIRDLGMTSQAIDTAREQYQVDPKVSEYLLRAASMDPTGRVRSVFLVQARPAVAKVGRPFSHTGHRGRFRS